MTAGTDSARRDGAPRYRLYTKLRGLNADPLSVLDDIRSRHGDEPVQLDLGLSRPLLVSRPDHVEHVWRNSRDLYLRRGMMWQAMQRLQGTTGIGAEGESWDFSSKLIQPLFTGKSVAALVPRMVDAINEAVEDLAARSSGGHLVDLADEMMLISHRVLGRVFLGDVLPATEANTVGREIAAAFGSMQARLALPFIPHSIPLPGDRRVSRAVTTVDGILLPYIERARREPERPDVVSMIAHAMDNDGNQLGVQQARNDVIGLFTGGTETTAVALTWAVILLNSHPQVSKRLVTEIEAVVGGERVAGEHVKHLVYTRMVLEESLRLYPPAWMIPRTLQAPDVLGGVDLPVGTTVVLSPYNTHRLPHLWPDPERFDPERFAPGSKPRRHAYAYYPFGGGIHRCLGQAFFFIEAALATAALISRFEMAVRSPESVRPKVGVSLRPRGRVLVELSTRRRSG
ncbi:cytochrome P450 (plasmid) [Micromonospora zamorensis]|uniref:cytochrome P450 n=1 Tax=Micromonospora zamorensis TaxID=709883 RepID=UPI002E2300C5